MPGFARPEILFEINMAIDLADTAPHQRFRKFHTDTEYKDGQKLGTKFCKAVRAGNRIYLRGQTGTSLDGAFVGPGDAGAQADQAMKNITTLLEEAGGSINDVCRITTYTAHRHHRDEVYQATGRHLKGVYPVGTGLIVGEFAKPNLLVEIDVEAKLQN